MGSGCHLILPGIWRKETGVVADTLILPGILGGETVVVADTLILPGLLRVETGVVEKENEKWLAKGVKTAADFG